MPVISKNGTIIIVNIVFLEMGCNKSKQKQPEKSDEIDGVTGATALETNEGDGETTTVSQGEDNSSTATSEGTMVSAQESLDPKKLPEAVSRMERIRQETLEAHNQYRELHGSLPLELSNELNKMAQQWAEHLAVTTSFEHSPKDKREGTGENLAAHTEIISGQEITDMWYNEIEEYDFSQPGFKPGTGHFTQVIWRNTIQMGLGISSLPARDGMYRYVANYIPSGNWKGEFQDNVLPRYNRHSVLF